MGDVKFMIKSCKKIIRVYYEECRRCIYFGQKHLEKKSKVSRQFVPIKIEKNNSSTLIIFQAPGIKEWHVGKAIQSSRKRGGSAGSRIEASWNRCGKSRKDFDIVEAVRCYPGERKNGRDKKPRKKSRECCSKILAREINSGNYLRIIAFGVIAQEMLKYIKINSTCQVINATHPNGGITNSQLDNLW